GFGPRRGGASDMHRGLDIFTQSPKPVHAGGDGIVQEIRKRTGFGRSILIRHNERVQTRYAHLSAYAAGLKVGDRIWRGEIIGRTGESGNATAVHLHYEIIVDGAARDPLSVGS
ncbi:MAG: M23 family metallopeptidase, partial [Pseudomonadota bacterium]